MVGIAALAASGYRDGIRETEAWRVLTEWLATFFVQATWPALPSENGHLVVAIDS